MKIQVHTKNMHLPKRLEEYIDKKVERLERYLSNITEANLELSTEGRTEQPVAQLTIRNERGIILRTEEKKQQDIFAAVDMVVDKMYRQIKRYKTKVQQKRKGEKWVDVAPELPEEELPAEEAYPEGVIVRRKNVLLSPMNEEEAIAQIELLGHDFFVFLDGMSGKTSVLYKREDGNYGVMVTELA